MNVAIRTSFHFLLLTLSLPSCSVQKRIAKSAKEDVLTAPALQTAHVGISIYEPATGKYWFNYQGDHFFVPASNTKIPTCYAAMKYLGDSLVGLRYGAPEENFSVLVVQPTGDPTFLHADFKSQPVWDFLALNAKKYRENIAILDTIWRDKHWGSGWSWSDYDADYMAERSVMPIYGNVIDIKINSLSPRDPGDPASPDIFKTQNHFFDSLVNRNNYLINRSELMSKEPRVAIGRSIGENSFWPTESNRRFTGLSIPFVTGSEPDITRQIISDSLKYQFGAIRVYGSNYLYFCPDCEGAQVTIKKWHILHSQPTDSLLKPMMHRSDNFFAEQSLLMVSNERLGYMNDAKIIDTLLKTDFKDLPQKPRWVDGSGLSRYNLFTPQDLIAIFNKMKNDFGMNRIKNILATGGEGTFSNYYKPDAGYLFAKTGTLSGVVAISGFLYTKKNKLLIFSVLVNNHNASATDVRRVVEKFIHGIRNRF